MTELTTVRVATTPLQAKLFVALLQAEGIAAMLEGDTLTDEFATSRRLMNVSGTEVKVAIADLERAREILDGVAGAIDDDELERQALAAEPAEPNPAPQQPSRTLSRWPMNLLLLFLGGTAAWMVRDVIDANRRTALFDYVETETGWRETSRRTEGLVRDLVDNNNDGNYEIIEEHTPAGVINTSVDTDHDGHYDLLTMRDNTGTTARWTETAASGHLDDVVVSDDRGRQIQHLRWVDGKGYQPVDG